MSDRLMDTHIPASFRQTLFRDFDVDRRRGNRKLLRQIDEWEPTDAKPGLLLQGDPGVGKTMLACALENEYHAEYEVDAHLPDSLKTILRQKKCPTYFIQLAELIALHLRLFALSKDVDKGFREPTEYLEIDQLLEDLKTRVQILIIDDVGKEHRTSTGFAEDAFDLLVRTRHNAGLTTIYTTNLPLHRWGHQYSDSMQSLIGRSSLVLDF